MKRMHFNIARLAKIESKEIMKPIPVEASHPEIPKPIRQQPIVTSITEAGTTVMCPPPPISKQEMVKRLASSSPLVISDLNIKIPQTSPKPTSAGDTVISTRINQQDMKNWEEEANSSRQPQIVKRKISETSTVMVQEIDRDVMIFPEYNLMEYYWTKEEVLEKPPSPYRRGIWEERLERGEMSIHYTNPNPIKKNHESRSRDWNLWC
ncbi:hypothetical protein Hanom_Chr11g01026091 [Helianthus anomalus]